MLFSKILKGRGRHMSTATKQCNKCNEFLPATTEYFYKRADSADGLRGDCKDCKIKNTLKNRASRDGS